MKAIRSEFERCGDHFKKCHKHYSDLLSFICEFVSKASIPTLVIVSKTDEQIHVQYLDKVYVIASRYEVAVVGKETFFADSYSFNEWAEHHHTLVSSVEIDRHGNVTGRMIRMPLGVMEDAETVLYVLLGAGT